jgi:hypothetical protein
MSWSPSDAGKTYPDQRLANSTIVCNLVFWSLWFVWYFRFIRVWIQPIYFLAIFFATGVYQIGEDQARA